MQRISSSGACEKYICQPDSTVSFFSRFIGQVTLARFRGDTTFGLISRLISTFFGGIVGMVMWSVLLHLAAHIFFTYKGSNRYISCGSGSGNPYGLGGVFAFCFPFFFYARIYWPGPPLTNIIFFVTTVLVSRLAITYCLHIDLFSGGRILVP
jgi:hypothetical protein